MPRRSNELDAIDVFRIVNQAVNAAASREEFAAAAGVSKPYLSMALHGKRKLTDGILREAKLRRREVYEFIDPGI